MSRQYFLLQVRWINRQATLGIRGQKRKLKCALIYSGLMRSIQEKFYLNLR